MNTVLFLRPTESLTVFLQQLGRGLRHAPGKDCLTVLDFVGQAHRRYRIDSKLKALLPRHRFAIDKEVELDFPHLPAGCSIQLDRLSRQYVLENIRENLGRSPFRFPTGCRPSQRDRTGIDLRQFHPLSRLRAGGAAGEGVLVRMEGQGATGTNPRDPDLVRLKKTLLRAASHQRATGNRSVARGSW